MSDNESVRNSGVGFWGLLGIVFIALKLTHVVAWPWWKVLLPLWGPSTVVLTLAVLYGVWIIVRELTRGNHT